MHLILFLPQMFFGPKMHNAALSSSIFFLQLPPPPSLHLSNLFFKDLILLLQIPFTKSPLLLYPPYFFLLFLWLSCIVKRGDDAVCVISAMHNVADFIQISAEAFQTFVIFKWDCCTSKVITATIHDETFKMDAKPHFATAFAAVTEFNEVGRWQFR